MWAYSEASEYSPSNCTHTHTHTYIYIHTHTHDSIVVIVQLLGGDRDPMNCSTPGFPVLLSPGACSSSYSLSQPCHPTISSSVAPFSSCPQSFPASGSLPMSRPSHQVAKVMELQFQHQSFQRIFRVQHQSFQWIFRVFFRVDWFDSPPCCTGTLNSLFQHHN